jgi:hypothetical protein
VKRQLQISRDTLTTIIVAGELEITGQGDATGRHLCRRQDQPGQPAAHVGSEKGMNHKPYRKSITTNPAFQYVFAKH